MSCYNLRNYYGQKAVDAFDAFVASNNGWSSIPFGVEDRYSAKELEWIRTQNVSGSVIDQCREEWSTTLGSFRFDQFFERMSGKLPIPIRWEADRILTFEGKAVAAVDVKAKNKATPGENWAVEIMSILANSKAPLRYGCPFFYVFPPCSHERELYGHSPDWTIATTREIVCHGSYESGKLTNGSGTPFFKVWHRHLDSKLVDFIQNIQCDD